MRPHALAFVSVALLVAGVLGCARTAEERQLDSMRDDIERIQDDRDRTDRPALPLDPEKPKVAPSQAPAPEAAPVSLPEVVRVGAPGEEEEAVPDDYADPDDTTPRPAIRVIGAARGRSLRGDDMAGADDGTGAHSTALDPEAKRAYDAALSLVNAKQYDKALDGLSAFLVKWPDHPYADHAMYWRGECYFARQDYAHASDEFEGLLARFPAGAKAPDALLKLGVCQQRLGRTAEAKESFDRLAQDYPQTDAARHIPMTAPAGAPGTPLGPAPEDRR